MEKWLLRMRFDLKRKCRVVSLFACCTVAIGATAAAQESTVEQCRGAADSAARIACLEAALAALSAGTAAPAGKPGRTPQGQSDVGNAPLKGERDGNARPAAVEGDATRSPTAIGARQVAGNDESQERLESAQDLQVASYTTVPYRRLQVELENGQIWLQIEGDTQRIRTSLDRNRTVDIIESALGGYKLRLNEMGRTIRVRRVR